MSLEDLVENSAQIPDHIRKYMPKANALPDYIPPHLQGYVSDFRNEVDGGISFLDSKLHNGLPGDAGRTKMSQAEYHRTFDKGFRRTDPTEALSQQYRHRAPTSMADNITKMLTGSANKLYDWGTSSQGKAIGTSGLMSGVGGAGLGYLLSGYTGTSPLMTSLLGALLGGGAGAAATAYGQRNFNKSQEKQASHGVDSALIQAVKNDYSLSNSHKTEILQALSRIGEHEKVELYQSMRGTIGAGAGVVIAKFLGAKGLMPLLASGIIGAVTGRLTAPSAKLNAMGQMSTANF